MDKEYLADKGTIDRLRASFTGRQPYGYAEVGGLFDRTRLIGIEQEITQHISDVPAEKNIYASFRKHKLSKLDEMPERTRAFVKYLNSQEFLSVLETISGIHGLHADPDLRGGIHAIGRGGFLKLHTDFNWHSKLAMHRRLNLLVYLNEHWERGWQGGLR